MGELIIRGDCSDAAIVGGKAASLARMRARGWSVPEWFVVPSSAFGANGRMSAALKEAILAAATDIGGATFAVRSSAVDEDGAKDSFAGQFLTLLDVEPSKLIDSIRHVRRSGEDASVSAYRQQRGADGVDGPSVIVQRMIHPDSSGVMFTVDPRTGNRGTMLVSAVAGLGDRLMAGEVDGWTWSIDRARGDNTVIAQDGGEPPLSSEGLSILRHVGIFIEETSGGPQDIEWALEGHELHVLQARPITTLPTGKRRVFDNSNIVESYPGVVSPMTFSFARSVYAEVYRTLMRDLNVPANEIAEREDALQSLLARFDGHVYYDLVNWHRLLTALPGYHLNARAMDQMMGVDEPLPDDVLPPVDPRMTDGLQRFISRIGLVRAAFGLFGAAIMLPITKAGFMKRLDEALSSGKAHLAEERDADALVADWRRLENQLLRRWDAPLVNDLLCMIAVSAARKLTTEWAVSDGERIFNEFLIGQHGIVSAEPPRRIAEIADYVRSIGPRAIYALRSEDLSHVEGVIPGFSQKWHAYVADFGDRCLEELKLESLNLHDDPKPMLRAILAAAQRPTTEAADRSPVDLKAAFAGRPIRGAIARAMLRYAGARVRDRENLRFERTRVFGRVRDIVNAIGRSFAGMGVLDDARDVFYLTVDEVHGFVEGWGVDSDLKAIVERRKVEAGSWSRPPDRFETIGPVGSARFITESIVVASDEASRVGLGCSSGAVRGIARIVRDPRTTTIAAGEILVARSTDPGWIALFANAAGVVVEKGSILSHSAIVAREMGIPCVVGIKGVLDWIVDGEIVEIDGATGVVRRIA